MSSTYETEGSPVLCSLSHRYRNLFTSQKFADCSFKIDQTTLNCHKLILSAASPVFEAMLFGPLSEKKCIEILDISPERFKKFIEYIYTGEINLENESIESIIELYYSAEKYILPDLAWMCLNIVKAKLRYHNILETMDLSFYMSLKPLLQICINFFNKCCLNEYQFIHTLNKYYYHISKDCLRAVINSKNDSKYTSFYVHEWIKTECKNLGSRGLIINDLDLPKVKSNGSNVSAELKCAPMESTYAERKYYKACQPFIVTSTCSGFISSIKSNRFISLLAVVINSRLLPKVMSECCCNQEYRETLIIEISTKEQVLHRQKCNQNISYNCDFNILLSQMVVLSPDQEYYIKFFWGQEALGAEYPCSLQSSEVRDIIFIDSTEGSILRGIRFLNLTR